MFDQSASTGKLSLKEVHDAAITPPVPLAYSPCGTKQDADFDDSGLDHTEKLGAFWKKARAPLATEEFERILESEREFWSGTCLQEVRSLEETVDRLQKEVAGQQRDRQEASAERDALRHSVDELRLQGERSAAATAAKVALMEATMADLREMLLSQRQESRQVVSDAAPERHTSGDVMESIVELQAEVAKLHSRSTVQEEPMRRLAELSGELSADLDQLRSEAKDGLADLRGEVRRLGESIGEQQRAHADVVEAVAELRRSRRPAELDETRPCAAPAADRRSVDALEGTVADLRAQLAGLRDRQLEQADALRDTRAAEAERRGVDALECTVADLRAELAGLRDSQLEQADGLLKLRVDSAGADNARTEQRLLEAQAQIGCLHRLVQDQRRELTMLSKELGTACDRRATSEADTGSQWRAVCDRVAEIEARLAAASLRQEERDVQVQSARQPDGLRELAKLETLDIKAAPQASDLSSTRSSTRSAPAEADAAKVPDSLKDNLESVVAAVQKVLSEEPQQPPGQPQQPSGQPQQPRQQQLVAAGAAMAAPVALPPAQRQVAPVSAGWVMQQRVVPAAAWRSPRARSPRQQRAVVGPQPQLLIHR